MLISHREVSQGAGTESSHKTWREWKRGREGRRGGERREDDYYPRYSNCHLIPTPSLLGFLTVIHYHNDGEQGLTHKPAFWLSPGMTPR